MLYQLSYYRVIYDAKLGKFFLSTKFICRNIDADKYFIVGFNQYMMISEMLQ